MTTMNTIECKHESCTRKFNFLKNRSKSIDATF